MSVEQPLWRALTGYRVLTLVYVLAVFGWEREEYGRPLVGGAYLLGLAVWTLTTLPRVSSAVRCTKRFLACDMAIGVLGVLLTLYADPRDAVGPTLPSIWVAGPVLAFAIKGGWRWAAFGSALMGAANIVESGAVTRMTLHNVLLVCVASIGIGYVVEVARASERTLARALQIEAATRERERLARDIHDSVLQVLAMVQRRGTAIGGEAAELGRMAGEQEVALRALVSSGVVPAQSGAAGAGARPGSDGGTPGEGPAAVRAAASSRAPGRTVTTAGAERPDAGHAGAGHGDGRHSGAGNAGGDRDAAAGGGCDMRAMLAPHTGARVSFAEPGAPVLLPADAARELTAAVGAALDNVRRHARGPEGAAAQAWILLEDEPDAVLVTVRDDGPGIPAGRLEDAEAEGRMGVALSIRGRLRDLGGSAELTSVPGQGTEVELRVPR